jgi:hypothetical protein
VKDLYNSQKFTDQCLNLLHKLPFMRSIIVFLFFSFCAASAVAQTNTLDKLLPVQTVEVSCGKCKLGLPGKTCDMAVRFDGKAYYVDGANIDSFGDAHAHDGMCNAIRKAEVQGELKDSRFKISYIKVLPVAKEEAKN